MKSSTDGVLANNATPTTSSPPRSSLPATLLPDLGRHLIAMRYGTAHTTPQAEYARGALTWYADLFREFPEIDLMKHIQEEKPKC